MGVSRTLISALGLGCPISGPFFQDPFVIFVGKNHQLRRHFRCPACGKEMQTLSKLVHHYHDHGQLQYVPHACRERSHIDPVALSIIGMESVPYQALIDRRDEIQRRVGDGHKVIIPQELFQLTARIGSGSRSIQTSYRSDYQSSPQTPDTRPRQQYGAWRRPNAGQPRQYPGDRGGFGGRPRPQPQRQPSQSIW